MEDRQVLRPGRRPETRAANLIHVSESPTPQSGIVGWPGPAFGVTAFAFLPDGGSFVTADDHGQVCVFDLGTGALLRQFDDAYPTPLERCGVTRDGTTLAARRDGGGAHLWDLTTWRHRVGDWPSDVVEAEAVDLDLVDLHFDLMLAARSPYGHIVATHDCFTGLRVLDATTFACRVFIPTRCYSEPGAAVSPDGELLATGGATGSVHLWDAHAGAAVAHFGGHTESVRSVAFSPDGRLLASAGGDVRIWSLAKRACVRVIGAPDDCAEYCAFGPDGRSLIASSNRWTWAREWSLATDAAAEVANDVAPRDLRLGEHWLTGAAYSPSGNEILAGGMHSRLVVVDRSTLDVALDVPRDVVTGIDAGHGVSADGRRMVYSSWDHVRVCAFPSGRVELALAGEDLMADCGFSPDGSRVVACGCFHDNVYVYDAATGEQLVRVLSGHCGTRACFVTPDGRRVVTTGHDGTVRFRDLESGAEVGFRVLHFLDGAAATVSADSTRIVSATPGAERHLRRHVPSDDPGVADRFAPVVFAPGDL